MGIKQINVEITSLKKRLKELIETKKELVIYSRLCIFRFDAKASSNTDYEHTFCLTKKDAARLEKLLADFKFKIELESYDYFDTFEGRISIENKEENVKYFLLRFESGEYYDYLRFIETSLDLPENSHISKGKIEKIRAILANIKNLENLEF